MYCQELRLNDVNVCGTGVRCVQGSSQKKLFCIENSKSVLKKDFPPTEIGSEIHRDDIATKSDPIVLELERKGAIVVGKSNTPEYGAGSNTFNEVFGDTVCPFDVRRSAGGSSGGAA